MTTFTVTGDEWRAGDRVRLRDPAEWGGPTGGHGELAVSYELARPGWPTDRADLRWLADSAPYVGAVGTVVEASAPDWLPLVQFPDPAGGRPWSRFFLPGWLAAADGPAAVPACTCPTWELFARGCRCGQMARERQAARAGSDS